MPRAVPDAKSTMHRFFARLLQTLHIQEMQSAKNAALLIYAHDRRKHRYYSCCLSTKITQNDNFLLMIAVKARGSEVQCSACAVQ